MLYLFHIFKVLLLMQMNCHLYAHTSEQRPIRRVIDIDSARHQGVIGRVEIVAIVKQVASARLIRKFTLWEEHILCQSGIRTPDKIANAQVSHILNKVREKSPI